MEKGYFSSAEYQNIITRISSNWSSTQHTTDSHIWDTLLGGEAKYPTDINKAVDHYTREGSDPQPDNIISPVRWEAMQTVYSDNTPPPRSADKQIRTCTKALAPESFIYLATKHNVDIKNIESVGIDGIEEHKLHETIVVQKPFGSVERLEDSDWYYYTFTWNALKSIQPMANYELGGFYWDDMVKASLPLAIELLGKSFGKREDDQTQEQYYNSIKPQVQSFIKAGFVEFGGYTIEARKDATSAEDKQKLAELKAEHAALKNNDPAQAGIVALQIEALEEHISNFNPGITFLIGISKPAADKLGADNSPLTPGLEDLAMDRAIIMHIGAIDDDLTEIADILRKYQQIKEESNPPIEITTKGTPRIASKHKNRKGIVEFDDEAALVDEFKEALKTLLLDTMTPGPALSDQPTGEEYEEWTEYSDLWNQDKNLIEIGITKSKSPTVRPDWDIAYVREYAPETEFKFPNKKKKGKTSPGTIGVQRLGKVKFSRVIGGNFNPSLEPAFQEFKESVIDDIRTVHFISTMHKGNSNKEKRLSVEEDFSLIMEGTRAGRFKLDLFGFVKKYVGPVIHEISIGDGNMLVAAEKWIKDNGGPIASHAQRNVAVAMTGDPTWGQKYVEHYSRNWINVQVDEFWQTLPERRDRLRVGRGPNWAKSLFKQVLSQSDVKSLVNQAIKCWLDPNEWLELACRYAMKELGGDALFERMAKDGTLDKLKATAEIAAEVAAAANTIQAQKNIQKGEVQQLTAEREIYNAQVRELSNRKIATQSELDAADPGSPEEKGLIEDMKEIDIEIKAAVGRARLAEMDSAYASTAAGSVGTYMPSSVFGVESADVAGAANDISKSIMKISDPNFKKDLCRHIIKYSAAAVDLFIGLYKGLEAMGKEDDKKKQAEKEKLAEEKDAKRERKKSTTFGSYFEEAMRAAAQQIAHAMVLFFVKKLLNEIILACQQLKDQLWAGLEKKKGKKHHLPGKANFNDLLAVTPAGAARDLAKKLGAEVDLTEEGRITDIAKLLEDMELLLSQVELCALLNNGEATLSVSKIVKNLIKTKYENLYFELRAGAKTLSYKKIKKFFMNFQGYIDPEICAEIQETSPIQLYTECGIPPYVNELCGELLEGHATKEQIEEVCNRAKLDRIEKLLDLIDKTDNPILGEDDCDNPNRIPQNTYPTNMINDTLIDQNLRTIDPGFKSEMWKFKNKLLTGYPTGMPPLGNLIPTDSSKPWQSQTKDLGAIPDKPILPVIRESLNAPFEWLPGHTVDGLASNFVLSSPHVTLYWDNYWRATQDKLQYYFSAADSAQQMIELRYNIGDQENNFYNFLENQTVISNNIEPQTKKYLYLYTENAPKIINGEISNISSWGPWPQTREAFVDLDNSVSIEGWYRSPLEKEFVDLLNENIYDVLKLPTKSLNRRQWGNMFNIITRELGDHLVDSVHRSEVFQESGKNMLKKFFSGFFPREVFPADQPCDVKDVSFLKIEQIKQDIRDRTKDLYCACPEPDIDKDTPVLSRSIAEGLVYILARLYVCETFLRLLPITTTIKIKDVFKSEAVVDLIVSNMVKELAILDYQTTFKTTTGDKKENFQTPNRNNKKQKVVTPSGNIVYIEEPPTKVVAPKRGKSFEPKFQSHVIYYANKIFMAKIQAAAKRGNKLVDPLTNKPYEYDYGDICSPGGPSGNPYNLDGIKYLLKEQIISVGNFVEKEFESKLDIDIKSWKHHFLSSFLYQHLNTGYGNWSTARTYIGGKFDVGSSDSVDNIFDLMPYTIQTAFLPTLPTILTKPRLYSHEWEGVEAQVRVNAAYTPEGAMNNASPGFSEEGTSEDPASTTLQSYSHSNTSFGAIEDAHIIFSTDDFESGHSAIQDFWDAHNNPDWNSPLDDWVSFRSLGKKIIASTFAAISKIGPNGGFMLQPYIRVKQHTHLKHATTIEIELTAEEKEAFLLETHDKIVKEKMNAFNLVDADQHCKHLNYDDYLQSVVILGVAVPTAPSLILRANAASCIENIKPAFEEALDEHAWAEANKLFGPSGGNTATIPAPEYKDLGATPWGSPDAAAVAKEINLGDLYRPGGAYININQWRDTITDEEFGILNSSKANEPHTNYFDQWMYGLRLVYVAPLQYDYAKVAHTGPNTVDSEYISHDPDIITENPKTSGRNLGPNNRPKYETSEGSSTPFDANVADLISNLDIPKAFGLPNLDEPFFRKLINEKAYILYEQIRSTGINSSFFEENYGINSMATAASETTPGQESEHLGLDRETFEDLNHDSDYFNSVMTKTNISSPPICEIPLIEVELPVGALDLTEQGDLYNFYENRAKKEGKTDDEAKASAAAALEQVSTPVPLGYFSYQDSIEDEFPFIKLIDLMTKTDKFERLFGKIFPIDNYQTLVSLHILMQTFELDEYTEKAKSQVYNKTDDAGNRLFYTATELKGGMFLDTKKMLRSLFYSNTQAADPIKSGAGAASVSQMAQTKDTGEDSWWSKTMALLLGDPPSYAQIFAMTPMGVLKAMVQATDPNWKRCNPFFMTPWTPAGFTMCLLDKFLNDECEGMWFGNKAPDSCKESEPKALTGDCPEVAAQEISEDYTNDERVFDAMMKDYGVLEEDRNWILRTRSAGLVFGDLYNVGKPDPQWTRKFSASTLFAILVKAAHTGKIDADTDLGVIFSTLKEYHDTRIDQAGHHIDYLKNYKQLIKDLVADPVYFNPGAGAWRFLDPAGLIALDKLFFDCEHPAAVTQDYGPFADAINKICVSKRKYKLAEKQVLSLVNIYNDVLAAGGFGSFLKSKPTILPRAEKFTWENGESIFSTVYTTEGVISIFEEGFGEKEIRKKEGEMELSLAPVIDPDDWGPTGHTGIAQDNPFPDFMTDEEYKHWMSATHADGQPTAFGWSPGDWLRHEDGELVATVDIRWHEMTGKQRYMALTLLRAAKNHIQEPPPGWPHHTPQPQDWDDPSSWTRPDGTNFGIDARSKAWAAYAASGGATSEWIHYQPGAGPAEPGVLAGFNGYSIFYSAGHGRVDTTKHAGQRFYADGEYIPPWIELPDGGGNGNFYS